MAYKHYTQCFQLHPPDKPFNEKDQISFVVTHILKALIITGVFALVGLLAGPIGAIIGGVLGSLVGFTDLIDTAADQWLNHRLVCLNAEGCAVGKVSYNPTRSDLGVLDNDQFIDVVMMPHPTESIAVDFDEAIQKSSGTALVPRNRYEADGKVVTGFAGLVAKFPANDILTDKFQGKTWLAPRPDIELFLGYATPNNHERVALHCEAEGDFWVRMRGLAPALAALIDAALVATAAGVAAGSTVGTSVGCAILSFFFGPVGCVVGGFLGGLLGGALGGAAAGGASYYGAIQPILQAIFDANPGDIEDANVGDEGHKALQMGDQVAVMGLHVYDGYHQGWNEFHPLMKVVKTGPASPDYYLEWQPDFAGTPPPPPPGETIVLTVDDMKQGLASENFRKRCEHLKDTWCSLLTDASSEGTRTKQQGLDQRWTIHPAVDGCHPADPAVPGLH